jgi:hypothetical protein
MATRIHLIHWKESEAVDRAETLRAAGFSVDFHPISPNTLRDLRSFPPDVLLIDLSRLPSQGRDIALQLRGFKSMRTVPFVFVDGDPEKIQRIRELLPDSTFTSWKNLVEDLKTVLAHPVEKALVPSSSFAAYAGAPLLQKLGIRAGSIVALIHAPQGFAQSLGKLPEGALLLEAANASCELVLWFVRSRQELEDQISEMRDAAGKGGLWILWPKLGSGISTDVSQTLVRKTGLANGLVDYKICAVDATWSGLRFAKRKPNPAGPSDA